MNYLSVLNKDLNQVNSINFHDKFITLNRNCNLKHWNSHFDNKNNIQLIILGRPVIEVSDWVKFNVSEESYITKFLTKKYIDLEIDDFCNQLNGAFSILVIDHKFNKLSIITDKLGIYPIYTYGSDNINSFQLSSNFRTLLDNINTKVNIDIVSIAEFLKKGFIYHPNTFYEEIKTLDNGSYYILDFNEKKITKKKYFRVSAKPTYNFDYLVNKLSKALLKSIERRTLKYFGKKGVFLSGGTDSRMILANSFDQNTDAITLYNQENHEIKITKNIAQTLNAKHELIKRNDDYYLDSFFSSIDANSGRSLPIDDHFLNIRYDKKIKQYDTILTGCYADWLFKGIALDRAKLSFSFIGKLPLYKLKSFNYNFFAKRTLLKKKYEKMIKDREDQIFSDRESHLNNEIARIFPLFQEETSATRMTLQQFFPWDSIFSDNDVIEIYQQIPAKYKINSEVYDKAVSNILNKVKNIPHANKKHKIGINKYYGAIIYVTSMIKNKILKLIRIKKNNYIAGDGSWINFKEYTNNAQIKNLWKNTQNNKLFEEMLDSNNLEFQEIINNDYQLIYKCIVLNKILYQDKEKLYD